MSYIGYSQCVLKLSSLGNSIKDRTGVAHKGDSGFSMISLNMPLQIINKAEWFGTIFSRWGSCNWRAVLFSSVVGDPEFWVFAYGVKCRWLESTRRFEHFSITIFRMRKCRSYIIASSLEFLTFHATGRLIRIFLVIVVSATVFHTWKVIYLYPFLHVIF